jgi:glycosyltransferase involved in cell wall biosynthesis
VRIVPGGVERARFANCGEEEKRALRSRYGLPLDRAIVLHVGHVRRGRNVEALMRLQDGGLGQVVVVSSPSTRQDSKIRQRLVRSGVLVLDRFYDHIEHLYQTADCYVFPVASPFAAIEFPLSVLEALSCGIPVVSTPFGGLPDFLASKDGVIFTSLAGLEDAVASVLRARPAVPPLSFGFEWRSVAEELLSGLNGQERKVVVAGDRTDGVPC